MKNPRNLILIIAFVLLTACGSSESSSELEDAADSVSDTVSDDAGVDTDESEPAEAVTTTIAAPDDAEGVAVPEDETPEDVSDDLNGETTIPSDADVVTEPEGDDIDDEVPFEELSQLELAEQFVEFMDVSDPAAVAECVVEEFESEGLTVNEQTANSLVIALFRCDTDAMKAAFAADFGNVESSSIAATPEEIDCSLGAAVEWMSELPLTDTAIFGGATAPQELIDSIVETCGVSQSDAEFLLNEA